MADAVSTTSSTSNSLQALSYGIQGTAALGTAWEQASALEAQGDFQLAMSRINQSFANMQADEVINQGNAAAHQIQKRGKKIVGSQRAAAAAQGLDVNDSQGSAGELIDDSELATANDVATARSNAWMSAWGIKTQANLNVDTAKFNKTGNEFAANQTLLTGGLKALGAGAQVGGIYAKSKTPSGQQTNPKSPTYPTGFTAGQLLDRSIYGSPKPNTKLYGGGWWQTPDENEGN